MSAESGDLGLNIRVIAPLAETVEARVQGIWVSLPIARPTQTGQFRGKRAARKGVILRPVELSEGSEYHARFKVTLRKSISVSKPIWGKRRTRARIIVPPMLDGMIRTCELKENRPLKKEAKEGIRVALTVEVAERLFPTATRFPKRRRSPISHASCACPPA